MLRSVHYAFTGEIDIGFNTYTIALLPSGPSPTPYMCLTKVQLNVLVHDARHRARRQITWLRRS